MRTKLILSEAELKYKKFDIWSKILLWPLVIPVPVLSGILICAKDDAVMLISAVLLIGWTAVLIIACSRIGKRRTALEEQLWEERNAVKRTGIFKEIYEEFRHDGFEFNIQSDRFLFDDCHRNVIECAFLKCGHEFSVLIDESAVSLLVDEETNHPSEQEIPFQRIASVDELYLMINTFVAEYAET